VASAETTAAVEVRVRIAASPETIFDFFTDPDKMVQWMGRSAELDARPGGSFRCDINGRSVASGEYLEIEPPHRVVFSWGWVGEEATVAPGGSRVEIRLTGDGEETDVLLIHSELPSEESAGRHRHGWTHYTERLAIAAAGGDAGPDPWATPDSDGATT
jgi:uncharacterized protein YndB with AHSA1/START domain